MQPISERIAVRLLERQISRIQKKIEKVKKDLIDSGFAEGDPMGKELLLLMKREFMKDLLPLAVARHRLQPYSDAEKQEYERWMSILYGASLEKPPQDLFEGPAMHPREN